jgi:hypothetical protein
MLTLLLSPITPLLTQSLPILYLFIHRSHGGWQHLGFWHSDPMEQRKVPRVITAKRLAHADGKSEDLFC